MDSTINKYEENETNILTQKKAKIAFVGVGSFGNEVINYMMSKGIDKVEFIAINGGALSQCSANIKIQLSKTTSDNSDITNNFLNDAKAAEESKFEIAKILGNYDLVFINDGNCDLGATSVIARIAKGMGAITVPLITEHFSKESLETLLTRKKILNLKKNSNSVVIIPKSENFNLYESLFLSVSNLVAAVKDQGRINLDIDDFRTVLGDGGISYLNVGIDNSENSTEIAFEKAMSKFTIKKNYFNCKYGMIILYRSQPAMRETANIFRNFTEALPDDTKLFFGIYKSENLGLTSLGLTSLGLTSIAVTLITGLDIKDDDIDTNRFL